MGSKAGPHSSERSGASSATSAARRSGRAPRASIPGIVASVRALCPILVGREAELIELEDALLAAARGDGRMVLLAGDPGMGKTQLGLEPTERRSPLRAPAFTAVCSAA